VIIALFALGRLEIATQVQTFVSTRFIEAM
jgi:hypothetical protein